MESTREPAKIPPGRAGRMQLCYCERCGALRVLPEGEPNSYCPACARVLRWIHGEVAHVAGDL